MARGSRPKVLENADRLAGDPLPLPVLQCHTSVRVYMGAGWHAGLVAMGSTEHSCPVWLTREQRHTVCYDARNIQVTT